MNTRVFVRAFAASFVIAGSLPSITFGQAFSQFPGHKLPMVQRSVLAGVEGRVGHLAYDQTSGRLFVAAQRANSIEVLDATGMKTAQSIKDVPGPSGVVLMKDSRRLAVACGDGTVRTFKLDDKGNLTPERTIQLRGEADQLDYDPVAKLLYVGHGMFLSKVDPDKDDAVASLKLSDFPEGVVIEPGGKRVFVNIAKRGQIAVVNRETMTLESTWTLQDAKGNYAMAIDPARKRLFTVTQEPSKFIALDAADGREVARVDVPGGAEDVWYDALGTRAYVSCGGAGGKVAIVLQKDADTYTLDHQEPTMAGAGTSVLVPERRRLIVCAPKLADQPTFLYFFIIPP